MTRQPDTEKINTSNARPGDVLITLTHPHGGGESRARLVIEDQMSGTVLIEVELTGEEFLSVISSTATRVSGATLPRTPERIGRRSQNVSTNIHRASGVDVDVEAARIREEYLADGWEAVRIDKTNYGRRVVAHRWIADAASTTATTKD